MRRSSIDGHHRQAGAHPHLGEGASRPRPSAQPRKTARTTAADCGRCADRGTSRTGGVLAKDRAPSGHFRQDRTASGAKSSSEKCPRKSRCCRCRLGRGRIRCFCRCGAPDMLVYSKFTCSSSRRSRSNIAAADSRMRLKSWLPDEP
jgi:hypothetical protein